MRVLISLIKQYILVSALPEVSRECNAYVIVIHGENVIVWCTRFMKFYLPQYFKKIRKFCPKIMCNKNQFVLQILGHFFKI